ncbi:MAG: hypothetical protein U0570_12410 [Phycisphaerales bacterium]
MATNGIEFNCPECGSVAEPRRMGLRSTWWWLRPLMWSVTLGLVPFGLSLLLGEILPVPQSYLIALLPFAGPVVAIFVAALLCPKDVPGKANFGRRLPLCIAAFFASGAALIAAGLVWVFGLAIVHAR